MGEYNQKSYTVIHVRYSGRTGNNMFQYAFARTLSQRTGIPLASSMPITAFVQDSALAVEETVPRETRQVLTDANHTGSVKFLDQAFPDDREYYVEGLFQRSEYYAPYRQQIREFFNLTYPTTIRTKDIAIHIRLTDYKNFGPCGTVLHPSYYSNILLSEKFERLHVYTDDPTDVAYINQVLVKLKGHEIIIHGGTPIQDFTELMAFDRIIISNSTFAWWAAFLGNPSKVWTPKRWMRHCGDIDHKLWDLPGSIPVLNRFHDETGYAPGRITFAIPYKATKDAARNLHLQQCVQKIKTDFAGEDYEIIVTEQLDDTPIQKGALVNLAFQRSTGEIFVMHDADATLPSGTDLRLLLARCDGPVLPFTHIVEVKTYSRGEIREPREARTNYGMVNIFWREQFERAYGFGNLYSGWGGEDTDMNLRARFSRVPGTIGHRMHSTVDRDVVMLPDVAGKEPMRRNAWLLSTRNRRPSCNDGYQQTDAVLQAIITGDRYQHCQFKSIGVSGGFSYPDLLPGARLLVPKVSIAVTTCDRTGYATRMLASLRATISPTKSTVVVIDDCSQEPAKAALLDRCTQFSTLIRLPQRMGVWPSWFRAAEEIYLRTDEAWFVVAQDDIEFAPDWVQETERVITSIKESGTDWGTLSLINFKPERMADDYTIMSTNHMGAACLVVNRKMWKQFRVDQSALFPRGRVIHVDQHLASWCRTNPRRTWAVCHVGKSLVRHFGTISTLTPRDMRDFTGVGFPEGK